MNNLDNLRICVENIDSIALRVKEHKETDKNLIVYLFLNQCGREIKSLTTNINDLQYCVFHMRNIFELYLILQHILEDEKAINNWLGQAYKDFSDINKGFALLGKKTELDISELENMQISMDKTLEESPFESTGPFNIRDLAKKYGYDEAYMSIYKLSSKLIHPSSIKVNQYEALYTNDSYLNIVRHAGVYFSSKLNYLIVNIGKDYE